MQLITRFLLFAAPLIANAAPLASSANTLVPGRWIVQLKPGTDPASIVAHHNKVRSIRARNLARRNGDGVVGGGVEREFQIGGFKAYVGSFDAATIEELKVLPEVMVVEQNYIMATSALVTQENAPNWGLARLSSRTKEATSYIYDDTAGKGTFSYVVDTGIFIDHPDFNGRAVWGANLVPNNTFDTDNHGHGTHVAGIIGSTTYGVAKNATLIAVKVFENGSGTASTVIAGFEWAVNDIISKGRQDAAVINMSLGGKASPTWDAAISGAWERGILAVVAAGNENQLAINTSPCRAVEALCVGNTQIDDTRRPGVTGSNYGDAVDIWAAGTNILSTIPFRETSNRSTARLTGTSMASPHVAGLVSYLRGLEGMLSAADVKAKVLALATPDLVTDAMGAANLMAFNGVEQNATNSTGGHGRRTIRLT